MHLTKPDLGQGSDSPLKRNTNISPEKLQVQTRLHTVSGFNYHRCQKVTNVNELTSFQLSDDQGEEVKLPEQTRSQNRWGASLTEQNLCVLSLYFLSPEVVSFLYKRAVIPALLVCCGYKRSHSNPGSHKPSGSRL